MTVILPNEPITEKKMNNTNKYKYQRKKLYLRFNKNMNSSGKTTSEIKMTKS